MKYKIRKGTRICFYDMEHHTWGGIDCVRDVTFDDNDLVIANNYMDCRRNYGNEIAEGMSSPDQAPNFGRKRREMFTYFCVPDKRRPLIEVANENIERIEE